MQKLSLMTFSRNHIERIIGMIEELYDYVDDIVLVDSSNKKERAALLSAKRKRHWSKLRIFYIVPLGFVETCRNYGLTKCKYDWVLYLDADERISEELKNDLKKVIGNARDSALVMKRYEDVSGDTLGSFTFQTRLYKKSGILYKGIVDERPIIKGSLGSLDSGKYYLKHVLEHMRHSTNEYYQIGHKFMKYQAISYLVYNKMMQEYLAKVRGITEEKAGQTLSGKGLNKLMRAYEALGFKRLEQELSTFDYFFLNLVRVFAFGVKDRNAKTMLSALPYALKYAKMVSEYKREPEHKKVFEISRIISTEGFVSFLHLDDEKEIKKLNQRYMDNKQGMEGLSLLVHLLNERYEENTTKPRQKPI